MLRTATLLVAIALALPAAAGAQGAPAPSLTVDTFFASPSGIAVGDFSPTNIIPDIPSAVAIHGDSIYTVGRTGSSISAGHRHHGPPSRRHVRRRVLRGRQARHPDRGGRGGRRPRGRRVARRPDPHPAHHPRVREQ